MSASARKQTRSLFDFDPPNFETDGRDWPNRAASRFVEAGGLRWHVQEMGEGPPLLLLHGTAGATHSFRDLAPALARNFRVLAPDLPGHGFTQAVSNDRLSLPAMAEQVGALLRRLDVAPVLVAGHSAGAAILVRMALDGLIEPRAIIGLNAALLPFQGVAQHLFPPMAKLLVLNPVVPRVFAWTADKAAIRRLIEKTGSRIDDIGLECYRRLIARSGHVAAALGMMARWDLAPLVAALPALKTRLDLVVGLKDLAVPPSDAQSIRRVRPGTHIVKLADLGHLAHEEDPDLAARHILAIARACDVLPD
jgi:magnesium chelatase accessory protein